MTPPEHLGFFGQASLKRMLENQLGLETTSQFSTGKWVNVAFLFYKLQRVFPRVVPQSVVRGVRRSFLAKSCVYVPTHDIQYATAQKPAR